MTDGEAVKAVGFQEGRKGVAWWLGVLAMNLCVPPLMVLETVIAIVVAPVLLVIWRLATHWSLGKIMRHFVYLYGKVWLWTISGFVGLECVRLGRERFAGPCVIVVNHWSFFDMFVLAALPVFDVIIYLRSWPFKLAWYAPFMRLAEYQDIESQHWGDLEQNTRRFVDKGLSILVFPQGHRSRDGRLGRFYSGAFKLAIQNRIPILPVCISGTDRLLPPGRRWLAPAQVRIECLDLIEPDAFQGELGHIELRKHVKRLMEACLARS